MQTLPERGARGQGAMGTLPSCRSCRRPCPPADVDVVPLRTPPPLTAATAPSVGHRRSGPLRRSPPLMGGRSCPSPLAGPNPSVGEHRPQTPSPVNAAPAPSVRCRRPGPLRPSPPPRPPPSVAAAPSSYRARFRALSRALFRACSSWTQFKIAIS